MSEFEPTTLGRLLSFSNGRSSPPRGDDLAYPVYGSNGIIGFAAEANAIPETIIIGRVGSYCGSLYFSKEACWVTDNAIRATARDDNCARFLFYLLSTLSLNNWRAGSGQPLLNQAILGHIPTLAPKPSVQRAIVSILGALDDKIEVNRLMNETLEALALAIFTDWFVDFGPTRAKMETKPPYMSPEIWSLFPDGLDGEGKPKGWLTTRWGELISLEYGKGLTGYDGANEPYPVFGTNGQIGSYSKPLCPHPGIIVGRKGAYRGVHFCDQPFFVIDTAFYVEPRDRAVELRWAYYEMLSLGINNMDSGSAIPSTSRADFYSFPVLYPQFDVQQAFVRLLSPFWERQKQCDQECKTLAALRDALLPKLMSGEIRLREAEKAVEAVA